MKLARVEKREWDNSRGVKRNVMAMAVMGIREVEELKEMCVCVLGGDHVMIMLIMKMTNGG